MPTINLLPWREARRKEREKKFQLSALMAIVLGAGIVYHTMLGIDDDIQRQNDRVSYLDSELRKLTLVANTKKGLEAKKKDLLARMSVIEQLQHSRTATVRLFNEIPRILPDSVFVTEFVQSGGEMEIVGQAGSNADVSEYMRRLSVSENVSSPKLLSITTDEREHTVAFKVNVKVRKAGVDAKTSKKKKGKK